MSRCFFLKKVSDFEINQQVACLLNASPKTFELRAMALVICELWATIQPFCKLQAVSRESCQALSRESYQSALYQVCIISQNYFKFACKTK